MTSTFPLRGGGVIDGDLTVNGDLTVTGDLTVGGRKYGEPKILWEGAAYVNATQTLTLSEGINKQPHGIVLAWSAYSDNTAHDWDWNFFFVPKTHPDKSGEDSRGVGFRLTASGGGYLATKYVYFVDNTTLKGHASNNNTDNARYYVLRYVVGV